MSSFIISILSTFLPASGVTLLWFYSPFKITLAKIFLKQDIFDNLEFDSMLSIVSPFLGKLSGCIFCVFFWVSLGFSILNFTGVKDFLIVWLSCNYIHVILNKYIYGQ